MVTRTNVKNLIWNTVSGGFTKTRAQHEAKIERKFHPNHYIRIKKHSVGNWYIQIALKPIRGQKRATAHGYSGSSGEHDSRRDSWYVRGRKGR